MQQARSTNCPLSSSRAFITPTRRGTRASVLCASTAAGIVLGKTTTAAVYTLRITAYQYSKTCQVLIPGFD